MLTVSPGSQGNILICTAKEKLTDDDYQQVLAPQLESLLKTYGKVCMLLEFGEDFRGWEAAALWDDAQFGVKHRNDFEKLAIVGGPKWVQWAATIAARAVGGEAKVYPENQYADALDWISNNSIQKQTYV